MDDFGQLLTQWTQIELDVKKLQEQIKEKREQRQKMSEKAIQFIQDNDLDDNVFKISSLQRDVQLKHTKIQEPLTYKFLQQSLDHYFEDHANQSDSYHKENLVSYIKANRKSQSKSTLDILKNPHM